ncbi:MAG: O-antigen ligase family protein [Chitinophagales bacterium]
MAEEAKKNIGQSLILLQVLILVAGLFYSNALKSISLVTLSCSFLLFDNWKKNVKTILKNKLYISIILLVSIYIVSCFISTDKIQAFILIRNKISWLFIPITLSLFDIDRRKLKIIIGFATILAITQALFALFFLVKHYGEIGQLYATGNVLPVIKIHHVQIAVLMAICVVVLVANFLNTNQKKEKIISILAVLFLFLFLHIFAVRTGIILMYAMLLCYLSWYYIQLKKWKIVWMSSISLVFLFFIFYQTSTNLKSKVDYMFYDIYQYTNQTTTKHFYSDSRRLQSIKIGVDVLKKYPIFGTGVGDLYDECAKRYQQQYPELDKSYYFLPHCQYLYFLSAFGYLLGFLAIVCFVFPLYYFAKNQQMLLLSIYLACLLFAIWDAYIGTLFGTCLYVLIIGIGIKKRET